MTKPRTGVPSFQTFADSAGLKARVTGCHIARLSPEVRAEVEKAWAGGYRWRAVNHYLTAIGVATIPDTGYQKHFGGTHDCS